MYKNITFIATTTNRGICFQSLIISIRKVFGCDPKILFTHQIESLTESIQNFSHKYDVVSVATGYDSGLSYNRNFMIDKIETEFFVLCDDDFIFDASVKLSLSIELMQKSDIDILGGVYKNFNFDINNSLKSYSESSFAFDIEINYELFEKNEVDLSKVSYYKGLRFLKCDCVNNFAIMRTASFLREPKLRWDEDMKISGEHIDFFTNNKIKEYANVYFSPDLSILHIRRSSPRYQEMRDRRDGIKLFESKLKHVNHI
ncbi:hypothetical protein [Psychrobacter sp. WY6]|uniref:hypothetical protein n=1 Tax=Psychrobacter sp. WY6 TaxID=2708350 RepID=UPI002022BE21|nr:hypothetical protein [Psychrobacter sp. WY6]